jgi:hypothetical protein
MKLIVNGIDMLPYLDGGGYKLTREDADSSNAGRTIDYTMYRARITTKFRIDATFKMLYTQDAEIVLQALMPEFVTVTYTNPWLGGDQTTTMYNNTGSATIDTSFGDGKDRWSIDALSLVER